MRLVPGGMRRSNDPVQADPVFPTLFFLFFRPCFSRFRLSLLPCVSVGSRLSNGTVQAGPAFPRSLDNLHRIGLVAGRRAVYVFTP